MIEKEKKYKLKGDLEVLKSLPHNTYRITQTYLLMRKVFELRVRKTVHEKTFWTDIKHEGKYVLTFKHNTFNKDVRFEVEIPIPKFLGKYIMKDKKKIIKNRYELLLYHEADVFIDEFISPKVDPIVKIEHRGQREIKNLPRFCGADITEYSMYKNKNIFKML